ncbi:unannotated protein [freshwater metagenome]|uniref:Unannotated protein n=1 Tax=freshwater metagenome TaxID=449393 RepID=A0A6J7NEY0_9ZZZZ
MSAAPPLVFMDVLPDAEASVGSGRIERAERKRPPEWEAGGAHATVEAGVC